MTDYKKAFGNNKEPSLKEGDNLRKSTIYICEGCGVDYATAVEAEECEKSHIKPVKIVKAEYGYSTERNIFRHIPVAVRIEMANGMEVTYYRKEER